MTSHTPSSSKSAKPDKSEKFFLKHFLFWSKRNGKFFEKRHKAQFFVLNAFAIITVFFLISRFIEPFTIIDTSQVPLMDEIFIFNNIKEKTRVVVTESKTCADLAYNLQEYKNFVENYALEKGYKLTYSYIYFECPTQSLTIQLNMTLQSPRTTLDSKSSYQWP